MKKIILLFIAVTLLAFATGDTKSEYTLQPAAYSVYADDIDLDGDVDIVTGHNYNMQNDFSGLTILNNNDGIFSLKDTINIYGGQSNVYISELNGDSLPDVIAQYYDGNLNNAAVLLYQNGNYSINYYPMGESINQFDIGKINDDMNTDIIFISNQLQFWGILYNNGTGNFSEPEYHYVYNYYPTDIDCGDLNEDEREDIVIAGADVEIYYSFESGFQQYQLSEQELKVNIVDFDNDGDNDIIGLSDLYMAGYFSISIYENLQNGNFYEHDEYYFQPSGNKLIISDFNNDSLPDILVVLNNATGHNLMYNLGDNLLDNPVFIPVSDYGETSRQATAADLDGNGYNDIITLRYHYSPMSNNLSILFNDGNGNFVEDPITNNPTSNSELQTSNLTCYPNPFSNETTISFTIEVKGQVQLQVFDLDGKLINTLISKELQPDKYKIKWNGTDKNGKEIKPGTYLIRLKTGSQSITKRVVKIK